VARHSSVEPCATQKENEKRASERVAVSVSRRMIGNSTNAFGRCPAKKMLGRVRARTRQKEIAHDGNAPRGCGRVQRRARRALLAMGEASTAQVMEWTHPRGRRYPSAVRRALQPRPSNAIGCRSAQIQARRGRGWVQIRAAERPMRTAK
jgi:hypothetical protein